MTIKLIHLNSQLYAYVTSAIQRDSPEPITQIVLPISIDWAADIHAQMDEVVNQIANIVAPDETFLLGVPGPSIVSMILGIKLHERLPNCNIRLLRIRKVNGNRLYYEGTVDLFSPIELVNSVDAVNSVTILDMN